tara:strand:- start:4788 stop:4937 length:150 start_codon:yes stop_codon:yes gene_type:complete
MQFILNNRNILGYIPLFEAAVSGKKIEWDFLHGAMCVCEGVSFEKENLS